jgi:AcrR family transcriptional regulator
MINMLANFKITVADSIYNKDPESSDLGKRIVRESIELIDEIGYEAFTFKKLGERIGSNESSIYRYFENKHKLLSYLTSWYWTWIEYQLVFETHSLNKPFEKLKKAIEVISKPVVEDSNITHINEVSLFRIIVNENSKSFLTKEVDKENKAGYFNVYKSLVLRLKSMIQEVDPSYNYPSSFASTLVESSLHQHFLNKHFEKLTDCHDSDIPQFFLTDLAMRTLNVSTDE